MRKSLIAIILSLMSLHSFAQTQKVIEFTDEILINSTIKIECIEKDTAKGKISYKRTSGTGFFFSFLAPGGLSYNVIVTNKHVIKDAVRGTLYFKLSNAAGYATFGKTQAITINDFSSRWISHPDTTVDLAIMMLKPVEDEVRLIKHVDLYTLGFNESMLPNDSMLKDINAIEDILMIGYPYGLRDTINDLPIVRKGTTATPVYLDYMGKKQFLIDMPVFGGSSGSPILIYNHSIWTPRHGRAMSGTRLILTGINVATFLRDFSGTIYPKVSQNITDSLMSQTTIPLYNLGIIIKSQRLLEFKPLLK